MNNVIVLLIDSVFSECLGTRRTEISSTPFIDSLKESAVYAPNVYSYGPYTDAASKALYCANKALDDYGYFFGLSSSEYNHFRLFYENGYETFGLYYPYYLLPSSVEKYIDHSIYTGGFKYTSVWGGKFEYYAKIKKTRPLTETEYKLLIKCTEVVFDSWLLFYDNIENVENGYIVKPLLNPRLNGSGKIGLEEEIAKFKKDPIAYIDVVLELGMSHPLASVNEYDYGRDQDVEFIRSIYKENKKFFSKLSRVNTLRNLKNNPLSIKKSFKNVGKFLKTKDKTELRYFGNYGMLLGHTGLMKKRSLGAKWQDLCSLNKQLEALFNNLDMRKDGEKRPFYASLHALEPHHNISFFSYDSLDHNVIKEELKYIQPVIDGCGKKFSGNLLYQVALRYVDLCIKRMYAELEKRNLLENTTVMLVSDHGTSYTFSPVRTRVVNTFHKENYNIPMLIWSKNIEKEKCGTYESVYCSDDVYPTLCDVVGITTPDCFTGSSMIQNKTGRDYVITEYMGPGVPDMIQKDVWISIRNYKYVIAYKNSIAADLNTGKPFCIFDLSKDPLENNNIAGKIADNDEILRLKKLVNNRYEEIRGETKTFLKGIV